MIGQADLNTIMTERGTQMDLKSSILDILKSIKKSPSYQRSSSREKETVEPAGSELDNSDLIDSNGGEFLEGMSSATARIVIEKNLPGNFRDIYDIKELQNQGRYYIAKIVEPPGKVVARLLVDKLNGTVHFPKGSLKS